MLSYHDVVRDFAESGLLRMARMLAATLPLAALIQVLANLNDYRQPAVAAAVWLAVLAFAFWLVPRTCAGGLTTAQAWAAVLVAVAAVAIVGSDHRAYYPTGSVDLAILGTVWLLALVALSHPAWAWIPGAVALFAVHTALLIHAVGANPLSLAQLAAAGYILWVVLIAFAVLRPTVAMQISVSARRAALASRSAAERTAAAAVQEDRRSRLALLEMEALPLLRGIADGTLDPTAADVRERCARHAAVLRHSLTDRAPDTGGLMAGLEPALHAASARGLLVKVQLIGDPGAPAPEVARAALAAVDAVLRALAPRHAMLTILSQGEDIELYLTFSTSGEPLPAVPDVARFGADLPAAAAAHWHAAVTAEEAGQGCLEISWRKAGAA